MGKVADSRMVGKIIECMLHHNYVSSAILWFITAFILIWLSFQNLYNRRRKGHFVLHLTLLFILAGMSLMHR